MKNLFSFLFIMACIYQNVNSQGRANPGEQWQLSDEDSRGMLSRLKDCGLFDRCNDNSKVIDPDNEIYRWIVETYPNAIITLVDARYRAVDQERYRSLRDIQETTKYQVKGYKTKLVKVEIASVNPAGSLLNITAGKTLYYDCFTICPPPNDSGCGTPTGG